MAANHAAAIVRCADRARLCAIADPSEKAMEAVSLIAPEATKYTSLTAMLREERLDVVHVCTPPATHAALAREALDAGCHVYVEKPFAEATAEATEILRLAQSRGLVVAAGHQLLYEAPTRMADKLLPALGRINHIESYFSFRTVRRAPGGRVPLSADLQLLDILPHPVYLLLHFLDRSCDGPAEVVALDVGEDGTLHALVRQGHVTASLVVTLQGRPIESYVRIVGTNGAIYADYLRGSVQRLIGPGTSGIDKILAPYRLAGQLAKGTTSALASRLFNRKRSYPGLAELFDAFYSAAQTRGPSPVSEQNIIQTTAIWEKAAAALRRTAPAPVMRKPRRAGTLNVLVTGGTGLLGSAIVRELVKRDGLVRVVSRRRPATWERVPGAEYVSADLGGSIDPEIFEGVNAVIHAAAETAGGWEEHQRNSIDATTNVIKAASVAGVRTVVHVSSLAVLASPKRGQALREKSPLEPDQKRYGPYVWGKLASERAANALARELGMNLKIVRPGPLVDFRNFEAPGRLGKRVGNIFVAAGAQRDPLPITDVEFAARTIVWMVNDDSAPGEINLLNPELPTRLEAVNVLRKSNPDLTVVWLPRPMLVPLSWLAVLVQRAMRPKRPAINIAKAFASPRYDTSLIKSVAARVTESTDSVVHLQQTGASRPHSNPTRTSRAAQ
jgi:predicted dehydrogenase/nucleoside-diphosphate-sugar epimerase